MTTPEHIAEWRKDFESIKTTFYTRMSKYRIGEYDVPYIQGQWQGYLRRCTEQATEIAELKDALQFVERWAVYHGTKPHVTAEQALSLIQYYPPIRAITKSYVDGKVPDTFNPYAQIAELKAKLAEVLPLAKYGAITIRQIESIENDVFKFPQFRDKQVAELVDILFSDDGIMPTIEATIEQLLKD
jgi:hypothetical protein